MRKNRLWERIHAQGVAEFDGPNAQTHRQPVVDVGNLLVPKELRPRPRPAYQQSIVVTRPVTLADSPGSDRMLRHRADGCEVG